ncbi:VOC family protein [Pedobacter sp.]|uniref:VOC family protein n=1 Tax=Pedobacter sp. TaxID=1411316 RepID=UPI003D7F38CC
METPFKPHGYNSLSPYLVVDEAQKLADLLKRIFDAKELRKYERADGKIAHLELLLDDSVLMLADSTAAYTANTTMLHFYVPDVHATFQKAIENNCDIVERPNEKDGDPDTRGSFIDFAGNYWSVSTQK